MTASEHTERSIYAAKSYGVGRVTATDSRGAITATELIKELGHLDYGRACREVNAYRSEHPRETVQLVVVRPS